MTDQTQTKTLSRRQLLGYGGALGAVGLLNSVPAFARGGSTDGRQVAVFGGGIAGLTAAHELAERGFQVTVYERRVGGLGGKARSMDVPGTGSPGRRPLPGEHGCRTFLGFYKNLPETMARIPFGSQPNGVLDNLVPATQFVFSRAGGPDLYLPSWLPGPRDLTPQQLIQTIQAALVEGLRLPAHEVAVFATKLVVFFTSSDARRFGQWEWTTWWDFIRAPEFSPEYQAFLGRGLTNLAAADEVVGSTNAVATVAEAFIHQIALSPVEGALDRVLNAPTNDAFIEPWVAHLRAMGVEFHEGQALSGLDFRGGRIASATVDAAGSRETVNADWFVCAVPVERASLLWDGAILDSDPHLAEMAKIQTGWQTGVQYYLNRHAPIASGHVRCIDSPWALTAINQAQFWNHDFAATYGDGTAVDCLSILVSEVATPGMLLGKPGWSCTREEIAQEIWAQLKAHFADEDPRALTDDMLVTSFLDPGIVYPAEPPAPGHIVVNEDPLMTNKVGSWFNRPDAATAIPNLFLAGDYARCGIQVASMEAANETGRRAANAVLAAAGSSASPVVVHPMNRQPQYDALRLVDEQRFHAGQPHLLDGIDDLIQPQLLGGVEDLLRPLLSS